MLINFFFVSKHSASNASISLVGFRSSYVSGMTPLQSAAHTSLLIHGETAEKLITYPVSFLPRY